MRNSNGECMADDIIPLCKAIEGLSKEFGVNMDISQSKLFNSIVQYVELRRDTRAYDIRSERKPTVPIGWTMRHEAIWKQWMFHTLSLDDWLTRVIGPIFGSEQRLWEPDGWREELYNFLPLWFVRSIGRFEEIDPSPLPDEEELAEMEEKEKEKEKRPRKIDPYVDDYYGELR